MYTKLAIFSAVVLFFRATVYHPYSYEKFTKIHS